MATKEEIELGEKILGCGCIVILLAVVMAAIGVAALVWKHVLG